MAGLGFAFAAVLLRKSFMLERSRRFRAGEAVEFASVGIVTVDARAPCDEADAAVFTPTFAAAMFSPGLLIAVT